MGTEYTFTFNQDEEKRFRNIRDRLDPDEFTIVEDIHRVDPDAGRYGELKTVMQMDPEAASTFRFGMKQLKIRRTRTEEELAAEKEQEEKNTITVRVKVDGLLPPNP